MIRDMLRDLASFLAMAFFVVAMFVALPAFVAIFHDQQTAIVAASERN
jgi:hypothetical protein